MTPLKKVTDVFNLDFKKISDDEIIALRVQIEKEFRTRKIKFTSGEIGEKMAIDFFQQYSWA